MANFKKTDHGDDVCYYDISLLDVYQNVLVLGNVKYKTELMFDSIVSFLFI